MCHGRGMGVFWVWSVCPWSSPKKSWHLWWSYLWSARMRSSSELDWTYNYKMFCWHKMTLCDHHFHMIVVMWLCIPFLLWTAAEQSELGRVEVEYIKMPGWNTSIAHSKSISDLPPNAKAYVEKIWELIGIPGKQDCEIVCFLGNCKVFEALRCFVLSIIWNHSNCALLKHIHKHNIRKGLIYIYNIYIYIYTYWNYYIARCKSDMQFRD